MRRIFLLLALGLLGSSRAEARDLNFDASMLYDPAINYERVLDLTLQFERDPDPVAQATSTVETLPQDAAVAPSSQPPVPPGS